MSNLANYSSIIDSIFGANTTTFNTSPDVYNHVIGALNNPNEYLHFKNNFVARLKRLKDIYANHANYLSEIIVQVNEVASAKNWDGAYAELAVFDHFNQEILSSQTYLTTPINPNVTLPKEDSFAGELGKQATNLDGCVDDYSLFFDVKCFKDNVTEILEGVFKSFLQRSGITDLKIIGEHDLDISYDEFQRNRNNLLNELINNVDQTTKPKVITSTVIPSLRYKLLWGGGVVTATRMYSPYSHAKNFHKIAFNYANKFLKNRPTLIVLVSFPWYNGVVTNFDDSNRKLYRAFSRRVFCQYAHDNTPFSSFNSRFNSTETIHEVSTNLSGIVFLEDNSIKGENPEETNVKSFVYTNPNAVHKVDSSHSRHFVQSIANEEYDDFEDDNY